MSRPLFHYCSTATFQAIYTSQQIRLNDLTMSNDGAEGRWAIDRFLKLCKARKFEPNLEALIHRLVEPLVLQQGLMAFCLSEEGDLLSQWRGYADDGCGLAIGFDPDALKNSVLGDKAIRLEKVIYSPSEQDPALDDSLRRLVELLSPELVEFLEAGKPEDDVYGTSLEAAYRDMRSILHKLGELRAIYKNPAFSEEREWRLFTESPALGGFYASRNKLIPYQVVHLEAPWAVVTDIVAGPKNVTPTSSLELVSRSFGHFRKIKISRSSATYR